jgi:hypothetical protein
MRNTVLSVVLAAGVAFSAQAADKPKEIGAVIVASSPVGEASLNKFFLHVYDAQFWSDSGDTTKAPYALSIVYAMGFSPQELADRTFEEMKQVSTLPVETLQKYAEMLRKIYPEVKNGDRITAVQKDAVTTLFYYNGQAVGKVKDAGFASAFFGIWLSSKSSEPEMQRKLTASH